MPLSCLLCSYFQENKCVFQIQFRIWKDGCVSISFGNPHSCSTPFSSDSISDLDIALWLVLKSNFMIRAGSWCGVGLGSCHDFFSGELKSLSDLCEQSGANPRNRNQGSDSTSEAWSPQPRGIRGNSMCYIQLRYSCFPLRSVAQ